MVGHTHLMIGQCIPILASHWLTLDDTRPQPGSSRVFLIMFDRCDELLGPGYYLARGLSYLVTPHPDSENSQLSAEKLMNTGPSLGQGLLSNWSRS